MSIVRRGTWPQPTLVRADSTILSHRVTVRTGTLDQTRAEVAYAMAAEAMSRGEAECVDHYFKAACYAWQEIQTRLHEKCVHDGIAAELYRSSLNALIAQGQLYQRFDPSVGLRVHTQHGWTQIPCLYFGFSREPSDFNAVVTVGDYSTTELNHVYRQNGVGVPTVVVRCRPRSDNFQRKKSTFPATMILRNHEESSSADDFRFAVEFHNPLVVSKVTIQECDTPIAYDKSAAIAQVLSSTERNYLRAFVQPSSVSPDEEGLFILEPYVEGKIPVLFVHGLLSDRLTWANVVNEVRANEWFNNRYQLWGFEYPTGEPFLETAAKLRRQLTELRQYLDPSASDEALNQVVLVGHSMGGLICKMQIAQSEDILWNAISERGFENVRIEPKVREKLSKAFFFESSLSISRVIFVGTPHRGSVLAQRAVGRLGSLLIEQPAEQKQAHRQLTKDNPFVFSSEFTKRIPTSIDLLEPSSPLLAALDRLPLEPRVQLHSVIGHGRWMPGNGDSDGVVPATSARQSNAVSEQWVTEKHTDLPRDPAMIDELLSILQTHFIQLSGL